MSHPCYFRITKQIRGQRHDERMSSIENLLRSYSVVDLSFALEEGIPYFPTHAPFKHIPWESPANGQAAFTFGIFMDEHSGTHVDSTMHFPRTGRRWIDQIPISEFIGRCGVIKCKGMKDRALVTPRDIKNWEKKHGKLRELDVLLFNYGWDRKFKHLPSGSKYLKGWPGLSAEAAKYIVESGVKLVGSDTISADADRTDGFPAHQILLSNEVKIIESLANLDAAPAVGGLFMAVPLKITHGSGSPVRAFIFTPKKR
jgi:kynurenine formamidase